MYLYESLDEICDPCDSSKVATINFRSFSFSIPDQERQIWVCPIPQVNCKPLAHACIIIGRADSLIAV